ncbi:hypothetical protein Tco_0907922 [Tanacetum coccineum]|uniref:Uncharacterized protein n=1 Tax=Tanacetum coccineum TaxID=301880 RepID=A0ABQ5CNH0_9ASTR
MKASCESDEGYPTIMEEIYLTIDEAKLKKMADEMLRQRLSIPKPDYKNLNKNDIEDMYLLIVNNKVPNYTNTGLLWSLSVFIGSSVIWERVYDFQLGIESYQQNINLTAPTITFPGIEEYDVFSIVYEPVHGIIYTNSKKEKRVMRHSEIHKFCDATLRRTLEGLKSYYNDVKYGYVQKELTNDEVEFLKLFEEEIEVRLNYRDQMRRWEISSDRNLFRENAKGFIELAWENYFKIKHTCKKSNIIRGFYKNYVINFLKNVQDISEELAKYIKYSKVESPAFYKEDDESNTIAIIPVLPTEKPDNSLSMGDEHLSTILETESDKVIKSSVEDLVLILSESEGISTIHVVDDDSFENIDYVEASPLDSELDAVEEIDLLNDNPTLDCVLKFPSTFPIPVKDSDSFFKKSDTFLSYSDNSLPKFETFSDHTEEINSGSTTTHADNSLPEYDSF